MQNKPAIKAIISGRVQGVFYRAETKKAADCFGINGYVKNLSNGCVEAVFQADKDGIAKMIQWCHKGSPNAMVDHVDTQPFPISKNFNGFEIRY